jgi:hydroxymethylbilane synthase
LEALGGNCHSPVAAHAGVAGEWINLRGEILSEDGSERHAGTLIYNTTDAEGPARLAYQLRDKASADLRALFAA